jgi:hypothetical protein
LRVEARDPDRKADAERRDQEVDRDEQLRQPARAQEQPQQARREDDQAERDEETDVLAVELEAHGAPPVVAPRHRHARRAA